jgi:hypothetical protein
MKPRSKKSIKHALMPSRKLRGRPQADVGVVQAAGALSESGPVPISKQSLALGAFLDEWEAQHGAFTTAELDGAVQDLESRRHAPRYRTAADVRADMPPPEVARQLLATLCRGGLEARLTARLSFRTTCSPIS